MKATPRSFVKWLGGKGRMLKHIVPHLPEKIGTYCEPMVGGGALFFELARQGRFKRAVIGDVNPELVNAYTVIRDNVEALLRELRFPEYEYKREAYLKARAKRPEAMTSVPRAARFIYLMKTCFNGLYRVNGDGEFNVPFGRYKNPVICDEPNLVAVSKALRGVDIVHGGYSWVAQEGLGRGDVAYFDPPYVPISPTSSFVRYTKEGFTWQDHLHLAAVFCDLSTAGVTVLLSNSAAPAARNLYSHESVVEDLMGSRSVGGPADYRKPAGEILVHANSARPAKKRSRQAAQ